MGKSLLNAISSPEDVKKLKSEQLPALCEEIRAFLIDSVSRTGGHLSSNLGSIELTVALHRALQLPQDKIVFDVGHQCYTHKILTGRKDRFALLRQESGLSGFPSPKESPYDAFVAGHGSTSLSVAIGMARAKKLKQEPGKVVAFIGDGAFTGGMVYEGMNNIGTLNNLIVILNDNKMSISKNVGSVAHYLTRLRTNPNYSRAKAGLESALDAIPLVGRGVVAALQNGKRIIRQSVYKSTMFEEMGFQYVGPVDGHNVLELEELLRNLQVQTAPLFIHTVTVKGKGYAPAEENPGEFHGVSAFDRNHLTNPDMAPAESFSTCFGKKLAELAATVPNLCAITAAMKYGTGLNYFYHSYPERFFDVGMAEEHAVTFAGGLASQGMRPVVALYSTFLQRAYDQIIHDVTLMKLPVLIAVDRAGLVPGDGETHQGIYDAALLSQIGIFTVSPVNYAELRHWLEKLLCAEAAGPAAIRYARGKADAQLESLGCTGEPFVVYAAEKPASAALVSYGTLSEETFSAQSILSEKGISADVIRLVQISPLPEGLVAQLLSYSVLCFAEDTVQNGGIGQQLAAALQQAGWQGTYLLHAVDNTRLTHATVPQLRKLLALDGASLAEDVERKLL